MKENKYLWFKIADAVSELQFGGNSLAIVVVNGKKITLTKHNGLLKACAYACPHSGGILADGYLDGLGNIVCPLHGYKFSVENGRNITGEGYFLKTYRIEERIEGIFVGFQEKEIFNF